MPNIVSLDMPAAFWRDKAHRARQNGAYGEAVRLYRAALRRHGDSLSRRELAATYADMRSFSASDRLYMENLARDAADDESLFGLARNRSLLGDEQAMAGMLDLYLRVAPCGARADAARDILWSMPKERSPLGKRQRRAYALYRRAEAGASDIRYATHTAKLSWRRGKLPENARLLCELSLRVNKPAAALRYASQACALSPGSMVSHLFLAKALKVSGLEHSCRMALGQARALCRKEEDATLFIRRAIALDYADIAIDFARERLRDAPHSADRMLLLAFALLTAGERDEVGKLLQSALAIDEDDPLAWLMLRELAYEDADTGADAYSGEEAAARFEESIWRERFTRMESMLSGLSDASPPGPAVLHDEVVSLMRLPLHGAWEAAIRLFLHTRDALGLRMALLECDLPYAVIGQILAALDDMGAPSPRFARVDGRLCLLPQKPLPPYDADLHELVRLLIRRAKGKVPLDRILRDVPKAWRALPQSARAHCALSGDDVWPTAFLAYLYTCVGEDAAAKRCLAGRPVPLRVCRAYQQLIRRMMPAYEMY